jgi:hypothetical protein
MLRRYLFIKLKEEFRQGLKLVQLLESAEKALLASYGVQDMKVGVAAGYATRKDWDLCISLMYVSGVDAERAESDTILRTFQERFLQSRATSVKTYLFEHDFERKGA